jgi:hypothetical protein
VGEEIPFNVEVEITNEEIVVGVSAKIISITAAVVVVVVVVVVIFAVVEVEIHLVNEIIIVPTSTTYLFKTRNTN